MKTIRIMNQTGDTVFEFDETKATATAEAEVLFEKLQKSGAVFNDAGKVQQFSDLAQENTYVPKIVAG